ncbi:MAG: hypothetical protein ACHQ51_04880, partial [Elusimicrobiota bacterium]
MRNILFAALLMTAFLASPARAVDTGMFNAVAAEIPVPLPDKYDERAVLAALLARPDVAAEFEADGRAALSDPQLKPLMVAKWRGRAAAYATTQVNRPGADVSKTYHNWKEVLGPEGYAYTRQRLLSMSKDNADKLIGYLGTLDQKLQANNFKIDDSFFGMSGKIVNGILDAYRKDLGLYLGTADAQAARTSVSRSAQQLASAIADKNAVAAAPAPAPQPAATAPAKKPTDVADAKPPVKPTTKPAKPQAPAGKTPKPETPAAPKPDGSGTAVVTNPNGGALDQARGAARAGEHGGQSFDGGVSGGRPTDGSAVVVPPTSGSAAGT